MTSIMSIDYAKAIEEKGIRPSVQRTAIFGYISENKTHPTVDNVYTALSPSYPTLSRTTVYNTLKLFAQNGLVQVVKIEDDELRYDAETRPHIHFKCERCGGIFDIFDEESYTKCIIEYISGMTDQFAIQVYEEIITF